MVPVTCEIRVQKLSEERLRELREKWEVERADEIAKTRQEHPDAIIKPPYSEEMGVIVLKELDGQREMSIWCGPGEATAIAFGLQHVKTQRPMTHDFLRDVVSAIGKARELHVTEVREGTFYAELVVADTAGEQRTVSCRPSDGIAFAVRAEIPILVAEPLFENADA
jgi:bifunctional DNase/RNase